MCSPQHYQDDNNSLSDVVASRLLWALQPILWRSKGNVSSVKQAWSCVLIGSNRPRTIQLTLTTDLTLSIWLLRNDEQALTLGQSILLYFILIILNFRSIDHRTIGASIRSSRSWSSSSQHLFISIVDQRQQPWQPEHQQEDQVPVADLRNSNSFFLVRWPLAVHGKTDHLIGESAVGKVLHPSQQIRQ